MNDFEMYPIAMWTLSVVPLAFTALALAVLVLAITPTRNRTKNHMEGAEVL